MKTIIGIVFTLVALSVVTSSVGAAERTCKPGEVYDDFKRRCVTPRGS